MTTEHDYAPLPDRPEGRGTLGPDGPPLGCLSQEDVNTINGITSKIAIAQLLDNHNLLEQALDEMTDAGSHLAGHTLQILVHAAGGVAIDKLGIPGASMGAAFVAAMPREDTDELHRNASEFAVEFVSLVLNGQFKEAMDHWGEFVNGSPSWDEYSHAVMAVLGTVSQLVTGELERGEEIPGVGQSFQLKG